MNDKLVIKKAEKLVGDIYSVADNIQHDFSDETWRTVSKLKNSANDAYFYLAQVAGAGTGQALEYDCTSARKSLYAVKSMYVFATKQHFIDLDPGIVVSIDELITYLDQEKIAIKKEENRKAEEDLKPWLEKYNIWKRISKD